MEPSPSNPGLIYYFRASLDGQNYFGGYCSRIEEDEDGIYLQDRRIPVFGTLTPASAVQAKVIQVGPMRLSKKHHDYFIPAVHPPIWYNAIDGVALYQARPFAATAGTTDYIKSSCWPAEVWRLMELPEIARLVGENLFLEGWLPFIETPDFLEGEDLLIEQWLLTRGEIASDFQSRSIGFLDKNRFDRQLPAGKERWLLRLSAARRLDALITGSDPLLVRPHCLAGELYLPLHLTDLEKTLKVGLNKNPLYGDQPRKLKVLRDVLLEETTLGRIEAAIFPIGHPEDLNTAETWTGLRNRWHEAAPLRRHQAGSRYGFLPEGLYPHEQIPGLVPRLPIETIQAIGQDTLHAIGLCAWWPAATDEFVQARRDAIVPAHPALLERWMRQVFASHQDRDGLS